MSRVDKQGRLPRPRSEGVQVAAHLEVGRAGRRPELEIKTGKEAGEGEGEGREDLGRPLMLSVVRVV